MGLRHVVKEVTAPYLESYRDAICSLKSEYGIEALATGDILDVCNGFMGRACMGTGVELLTPLWDIDRRMLLALLWHYQLEAVVSCVNLAKFRPGAVTQQQQQIINKKKCTVAARTEATPVSAASSAVHGGTQAGLQALQRAQAPPASAAAVPISTTPSVPPSSAAAAAGSSAQAQSPGQAGVGTGALSAISTASDVEQQAAAAGSSSTASSEGAAQSPPPSAAAAGLALLGQVLSPAVVAQVLQPAAGLGVDLAGEGGEYHTMCVGGGIFMKKVVFRLAEGGPGVEGDYGFITVSDVRLEDP